MAERNLHANLKKRLINNEAFVYAHLIKYERPYPALKSGKHSTDAKRYAYLTDGAVNMELMQQMELQLMVRKHTQQIKYQKQVLIQKQLKLKQLE